MEGAGAEICKEANIRMRIRVEMTLAVPADTANLTRKMSDGSQSNIVEMQW